MAAAPLALLETPEDVRLALSPIRRQLLERLRLPASATQLAAALALGRQRINYHLRALEQAGLVELVEERQRRGCLERILVARARAFVVDPAVMGRREASATQTAVQDRFAASHLIDAAGDIVRDVARMQAAAQRQGTRLLTFTIDTDVSFATPAALQEFTAALAELVARHAAKFDAAGGRRYRVVIAGHPAPRSRGRQKPPAYEGESHAHPRSRHRRDPRRRPH